MARAIWTGNITVGLLSIPVKLLPAVKRKSIAFKQIDDQTGSRIRYQKVSEATGEQVASEHIVKSLDLGGDHFVIVVDADLAPLASTKSKEIGIDAVLPGDQIPMVMFDASYLIQPGKMAAKPYALLVRALAATGRLSERELVMARSLVDALSDPFDPTLYVDEYLAAVMELIEAKAAGRTLTIEDGPAEPGVVVDLAAALEASVEAANASRGRHPTARTVKPATTACTAAEVPATQATARRTRKSA